MLVKACSGNALSRAQCYRWFEKFQNGYFNVRNEERGRPAKKKKKLKMLNCKHYSMKMMAKCKKEHLAEQLNVEQSPVSCRLKAMVKIIKVGRWVPHELTDRQ
ncbi:mariner Mos1 transposase [Trichonephila clavipes]|nr:mariner Mos1 transposase [Trichonephila clavipes]